MSKAFILLGSNLGNTFLNLQYACSLMTNRGIDLLSQSFIYQTKAWGNINQDDFLNVVVKVETAFEAHELLKSLLEIELEMGRVRGEEQWMPRLIDLDILYFNDEIIDLPNLKIPHPYLAQRRFTLVPLNDVDAEFIHPVLKWSNKILLEKCEDKSEVMLTNFNLEMIKQKLNDA